MKKLLSFIFSMSFFSGGYVWASEHLLHSDRWREDYSYLKHRTTKSGYEKIKYIPLSDSLDEYYLSIGGDFRERINILNNDLFGFSSHKNGSQALHRILLHADLHRNNTFRFFLQLGSYSSSSYGLVSGVFDNDPIDIQQGFLDFYTGFITTRIGRQEFYLGSSRLISVREVQNIRRSFDGILISANDSFDSLKIFALEEVNIRKKVFDNKYNSSEKLWGIYYTHHNNLKDFDLYYLGSDRANSLYQENSSNEERHTIGARTSGNYSEWKWDYESSYQWGKFGNMSIDAWAFSTLNSYKLPSFFWTPLLTLSFNLYSGDRDKNDKFLNTYNPLFPNLTHFGEAAILSPQNMMNLMPGITVYPFDYLTIAFDWDLIWRLSRSDSVYVRGARPLKGTDQVNGYFVTDVLSANIDWRINKHTNLGFGFSHYFAHNVIKDAGGTEVNYFKVQLKYSY